MRNRIKNRFGIANDRIYHSYKCDPIWDLVTLGGNAYFVVQCILVVLSGGEDHS